MVTKNDESEVVDEMDKDRMHDSLTFEDTLGDYFECHGINISGALRKTIHHELFETTSSFHPVCALQFGSYLLLATPKGKKSVKRISFLNLCSEQIDHWQ